MALFRTVSFNEVIPGIAGAGVTMLDGTSQLIS